MSRLYYYFMASLPALNFDGKPPMTFDDFLQQCEQHLHPQDFQLLQLLADDGYVSQNGTHALRDWMVFYGQLRNELTFYRAQRAGRDPQDFLRGDRSDQPQVIHRVEEIARLDNVLAAEQAIDRLKWDYINDLESRTFFQFENVVFYMAKLKIVCRYELIRSSAGAEKFDQIKQMDLQDNPRA